MPAFEFPVGASAGRGDSSLWELDFIVSDEEAALLKKHAEESTCLSEIEETSAIYDRLLPELLAQQAEVYEDTEELLEEVAESLEKPVEELSRDDVIAYLKNEFDFSIYFPKEMIPEDDE